MTILEWYKARLRAVLADIEEGRIGETEGERVGYVDTIRYLESKFGKITGD